MNANIIRRLVLIILVLIVIATGCSNGSGTGESQKSDNPSESRGEHEREGSESDHEQGKSNGEGEHSIRGDVNEHDEESGIELALDERYDKVRNGARLIMVYDAQSNSFTGTAANTTDNTLKLVRVEVHLSNGIELGPTTPTDLAPGEKIDITLLATKKEFAGWVPHAEVGIGD
ncbi:hypothetical protein ACFLUC_03350 [Chloroflexota bacterium]